MNIQERVVLDDWVVNTRLPVGSGTYPVFLLLHGWTGDEDAMDIFIPRLPKEALLLAPRGIYEAEPGGFSWYKSTVKRWPSLVDFNTAVEKLLELLNPALFPEGNFEVLHLVGFSQGAATAYAFTLLYPERISSTAGLAGFMPEGVNPLVAGERLKGLRVFVSHGTQDTLVPVERGREAAYLLEKAGAVVTYCEDDVGHKLSAACFRGLESFYQNQLEGCQE